MGAPVIVVVPCYREPIDIVAHTVESALAVSGVTGVTLVDDGTGREDLESLGVRIIHRAANGGPSAALNDGIAAQADDAVICRLDVRDVFYPEPKARQIETVLRGDCRASFSPHFDPVTGRDFIPAPGWQTRIYKDSCFTGVTTVYQRSVWAEVGIDTSYRWAEDWRFSLMIQHYVGFAMFPEVTCSAGMFPGGHTDCSGDREKYRSREHDRKRVIELGKVLGKPDQYAHLYNEKWCKQHGIEPLRRKT